MFWWMQNSAKKQKNQNFFKFQFWQMFSGALRLYHNISWNTNSPLKYTKISSPRHFPPKQYMNNTSLTEFIPRDKTTIPLIMAISSNVRSNFFIFLVKLLIVSIFSGLPHICKICLWVNPHFSLAVIPISGLICRYFPSNQYSKRDAEKNKEDIIGIHCMFNTSLSKLKPFSNWFALDRCLV